MLKLQKQDLELLQSTIGKVIPKKTSLPILQHVLIAEGDSGAEITGSDLETSVTVTLAVCDEPATKPYLLKWADLAAIKSDHVSLQALPDGKIKISNGAGERVICCTESVDDYPLVKGADVKDEPAPFSMSRDFLPKLALFSHAASMDKTRQVLQGVNVQNIADTIGGVITDGHRMNIVYGVDPAPRAEFNETWPVHVVKMLAGTGESAMIYHTARGAELRIAFVSLERAELQIMFRVLGGKYPNWRRVIPNDLPYSFTFDASDMKRALKSINLKLPQVNLTSNDGELRLQQIDSDSGAEYKAVLPVAVQGAAVDISFNPGYLLNIVSVLGGWPVTVKWHDCNSATLITSPAFEAETLLMPVRQS
jgi:DNA polymerase III subunit beta